MNNPKNNPKETSAGLKNPPSIPKETSAGLKKLVMEKYGSIAEQSLSGQAAGSCCGTASCCATIEYEVFADDYTTLEGYQPDADLGLGCGLPTEFAQIKPGDTVVDLGSGAGNDCFVARQIAGETGRVIGIDFTEAMVDRARENVEKLGFNNVEFHEGDIEDIPLPAGTADVVVSNCVMNLVPDKPRAFAETFRILKPGGHFSISDVVLDGDLPEAIVRDAELYAGCVSGAIAIDEYLNIIREAGFSSVTIQKKRVIALPDALLKEYLSREALLEFRLSGAGIYSITVYADKKENT
jgi:arsenite methyltransferase